MNTLRLTFRRCLGLVCAGTFLASSANAQTPAARGKTPAPAVEHEQFPADHPAFQFDLPAGWVEDRGNNDKSMLICNVKGHAEVGLLCMSMPEIFSLEDFTKILPGLAHDQLDRQNASDIQILSQGTDQTRACPYFFVITKSKTKDRTMSVTFIGLMSAQNRGYLIEYALPSADGPARIKDFQTIITSLTLVK